MKMFILLTFVFAFLVLSRSAAEPTHDVLVPKDWFETYVREIVKCRMTKLATAIADSKAHDASLSNVGWYGWMKTPRLTSCRPYAVSFALSGMHAYINLPTCRSSAWFTSEGLIDSGQMGAISPAYSRCGKCAPESQLYAQAHWNLVGCPSGKVCLRKSHAIGEEIASPLPMHPRCAWGLVNELKTVYNSVSRRAHSVADYRAALYVLGVGGFLKTGAQLLFKTVTGRKKLFAQLARDAAHNVDWKRRLSPSCWYFRDKHQLLDTARRSAVCWNFLADFRDLYCHYKINEGVNFSSVKACNRKFRRY